MNYSSHSYFYFLSQPCVLKALRALIIFTPLNSPQSISILFSQTTHLIKLLLLRALMSSSCDFIQLSFSFLYCYKLTNTHSYPWAKQFRAKHHLLSLHQTILRRSTVFLFLCSTILRSGRNNLALASGSSYFQKIRV